MEGPAVESAADILACVREQEVQFERLTQALENERRDSSFHSMHSPEHGQPSWNRQITNGPVYGSGQGDRWLIADSPPQNGPKDLPFPYSPRAKMLQEPGPYIEETVTVEEDPDPPASVVSLEMDDDGTTRRTETRVKKVIKTVTTRTVQGLPGEQLPPEMPMPRGVYAQTLDRNFRGGGGGMADVSYSTVPRGYTYQDAYGSLPRGARVEPRYQPASVDSYRGGGYGAQPQVLGHSRPERFMSEPYGLEDDQRSLGYDDGGGSGDYGLGMDYGTARRAATPSDLRTRYLRSKSFDDPLVDDGRSEHDAYYWAPLAQQERAGSLASLVSARREPVTWRQPELPEVIAMLNYRLDAVKANAAAYLQHLCFRNDKVKAEVRRLKGIPVLVELLDNPKKEVHLGACGALKNISYGRDADNKKAIRNCDGIPALVRLLRKARDMDLNEVITGTLWNLSSHDAVKMDIVDHAVPALCDEVIIPHSGWESKTYEDAKPRHVEWESVLTNTAGCLRNVSSEKREARQKLRECSGLVDSLMHILQSAVEQKDVNSKLVENCVCLLRNLSFQVHREIPEASQYQEAPGVSGSPAVNGQTKASCFGGRKGKGRKNGENASTEVDLPKRASPAKGYELLYQPEVVRLYLTLMRESSNPAVLEAVGGALQNLCAGRWTYGRYLRSAVRQEKGLSHIAEHLTHRNDRVVKAISGALRNLSLDARNKELIGKHAMPDLVHNLPPATPGDAGRDLSEDAVVSVLQTINELLVGNVEAARKLMENQGVERLVSINRTGTRSEREMKAASAVLVTLWSHRELRKPLEKDGWKKADFQPVATRVPTESAFDDSTLPLITKSQGGGDKREMIPLDNLGPDLYSTIDRRDPDQLRDGLLDVSEQDPLKE